MWQALNQILDRRDGVPDKELPRLKTVLTKKEKQIDEEMAMLYAEWAAQKPVQGTTKPSQAMEIKRCSRTGSRK